MCHHRAAEYERLYEDTKEREGTPDWDGEEVPQWEQEDAEADEETEPREPVAPGAAD